jgi:hypothetical protein
LLAFIVSIIGYVLFSLAGINENTSKLIDVGVFLLVFSAYKHFFNKKLNDGM